MSSVFRAVHVETRVEVAVKILPRNLARNKTLLQRFLREARSAEALEHPNIVAIYDHGVDNGQYYLVLEYIAGGDLHDWVRDSGPMPVREAVDVIKSAAEGLSFAAQQGLIHRDIKPANLLRGHSGIIKIADLGLALHAEAEDERVTREGTTVGTVDYMAPEQARDSRGTSERSDIYSLGCTLYFLLTGLPPFPGGDVTEKLSRHFTATPPDPREFRPEIPEALSQVLRKMMAKRPEYRYANYSELIAALDSVPVDDAPVLPETRELVALFDDEEEGARIFAPFESRDATSNPPALDAILDDSEADDSPVSDGFLPLDLTEGDLPTPTRPEARLGDVSMADLAELVDDHPPPANRVEPARPPLIRHTLPTPPSAEPDLVEEDHEPALEGKMPGQFALGAGTALTDEERRWLKMLVLSGVGLLVAIVAFHQLYRATISAPTPELATSEPVEQPEPEPAPPEPIPPAPAPTPAAPKPTQPAVHEVASNEAPKGVAPVARVSPTPAPPIEKREPPKADQAEAAFPPEVEVIYRPDWASLEAPNLVAGSFLTVRRLTDPRAADQKSRLGTALETIGNGTIEIADNGPFFEDDLRFSGDTRLIRARAGFRPMICLTPPRLEVVRQQSAVVEMEARTLILEGLDLIVDAKDLPRNFGSIFLCRGGSLTLRDCTVTVVNRIGRTLSFIRTGPAEKPSRARIERTLVRGSFTSVIDLTDGAGDVVIARSVVVNSLGAAIESESAGELARRIYVTRSAIATRASAFGLRDPKPGVRARPPNLRALGTTFTHLASSTPTSFIACVGDTSIGTPEMLDWQGEGNTFAGWSGWMSAGTSHRVMIADLAAARATWSGTDVQSVESDSPRSLSIAADRAGASTLREMAPERAGMLSRIPVPTVSIHEKTLEPFPRPLVPGLTSASGLPNSGPLPASPPGMLPPAGHPRVRQLTFDAEALQWSGDLGRFLAESIHANDSLVRVSVTGISSHIWSPVRIPDGVSLAIEVVPDLQGRAPSWSAALPSTADTLLVLRGGSLVLSGVKLSRGGAKLMKNLVRVEGGHLVIHRCRLIARGPFESGGGGLLEFNSSGNSTLKPVNPSALTWPFDVRNDRPTCRVTESVLITGGEVISATIGRGLVAFSQCAIAAGSSAFSLRPAVVARNGLDADLWLDHCTVASERAFVTLGAWLGDEPGPDRPWLVSTNRCGFFASYEHRMLEHALLLADPESFARGTLLWQTSGDAFEVPVFTAATDMLSPTNVRPDVTRQWADLWGRAHARSVTGPQPPNGSMNRWLVTRVLKPGEVQPGDLAVDVNIPIDDPPRDLGVDLSRLKITPSKRSTRKR